MDTPLVTRDLAFRLEASEAEYCEAKLRALKADDGNSRGVEIARLGRSVLLSIRSRRHNPSYNRVMCFSRRDQEHLDDILRWLRDRAARFWFDVVPALVDVAVPSPADGSLLQRLADASLHPSFFMGVVYTVPREIDTPPRTDVVVQEISLQDRLHDFAVTLSGGLGIPGEVIESTKRSAQLEYGAPGWHTYLASIDGSPASVATLYVKGTTASIDAMATVPRYRRRGCQTALLRRCITDSARAGCELLVSQTVPSSTSEKNMLRSGFQLAYTKVLYAERSTAPG